MKPIYKVTKENLELFQIGTMVDSGQAKYLFLPFWLEVIDDETVKMHLLGDLPKDLIHALKVMREGDIIKYPATLNPDESQNTKS